MVARRISQETKDEAVELYFSTDMTAEQVAELYSVDVRTFWRWVEARRTQEQDTNVRKEGSQMQRPFSQAGRDEAVRVYFQSNLTVAEAAETCDVADRTFTLWVTDFRARNPIEARTLETGYEKRRLAKLRSAAAQAVA